MNNRLLLSKKTLVLTALTVIIAGMIAFVLPGWLFPHQPRLTNAQHHRLFTFQSRYIDLADGTRVHYVEPFLRSIEDNT